LFRVFDELGLTKSEIASIVRWEGSLWARERYEKDNGVRVRDTTAEDVAISPIPLRPIAILHTSSHASSSTAGDVPIERTARDGEEREIFQESIQEGANDDDSEGELESVGLELNQRLLAATEALNDGHPGAMDPEFEQWLKEAAERGTFETVAGRSYPMSPNPAVVATVPTIDPVDIVASYASHQSPTATATSPEPLASHATLAIPTESILDAESSHRQTETAI